MQEGRRVNKSSFLFIVKWRISYGVISLIDAAGLVLSQSGSILGMGGLLMDVNLILWRIIPFAILWTIWKERIERIFKDTSSSVVS